MADRSGHSPALAHRKADATRDEREAELHEDRVRLGPPAAVDHEADALLVVAALALVSVDLQQLGVDVLEGVRIG